MALMEIPNSVLKRVAEELPPTVTPANSESSFVREHGGTYTLTVVLQKNSQVVGLDTLQGLKAELNANNILVFPPGRSHDRMHLVVSGIEARDLMKFIDLK